MKNKVLIVEDEEILSSALKDAFVQKDFLVVYAGDGQKGLEVAEKEKPDLILLDILMPVMDGWTMLEKLRAGDEYAKNVPVIMLTNLSADKEEAIKKVVETRPMEYIVKTDISISDVVARVKEILQGKKSK